MQDVAACVKIMAEYTSIYRWQGKNEHTHEIQLLIKTTRINYSKLESSPCSMHPCEAREILRYL
jgi:periplasmic divalent cation tolerance protein